MSNNILTQNLPEVCAALWDSHPQAVVAAVNLNGTTSAVLYKGDSGEARWRTGGFDWEEFDMALWVFLNLAEERGCTRFRLAL